MGLGLILLGVLCIGIALHPFTTYPISLWLLRRFRFVPVSKEPASAEAAADLAICMCAYNEERVIDAKMANLLALKRKYPGLEILVYVDAATDRTAEKLRAYEHEIRLHVASERHGKTHGMNVLVAMVTKPIIMFTDANVMIDLEAPARFARYFRDPEIGCVSSHLKYTNGDASITANSGSLYWRLDEWTKRLETDTGSAMGADGSLFAVRRSLHRPPPDEIIDDMYVSIMVFCEGSRVVQADDVIAYEESVTVAKDEFRRKVRIGCGAFNAHRAVWPRVREQSALTLYKYISHKVIRWLTIYFLLAGWLLIEVGLAAAGYAAAAAWLAGLSIACLLIGALSSRGPLAQIWDILSAFVATGLGVLRAVRGHNFQTWTPIGSIRK